MTDNVDGRREAALRGELLRRAAAVFGARADAIEPGEIMHAILGVAARIGEEVTRRLDQVPQKQAANFYAGMGLGRTPAVPATLPVSMTLTDAQPEGLFVPAGTKLQAEAGDTPVIFETLTGLDLAVGAIAKLCAIDVTADRIFLASGAALAPVLPYPASIRRRLASDVSAGVTVLQIEPATGLTEGAVLRIGDTGREKEHTAEKVDGDLVTISPPLDSIFRAGEQVVEVTAFSPWDEISRDHQSHQLYLGHATLLDIPSATTILVSGVTCDQVFEWRWFGKTGTAETAEWKEFTTAEIDANGRWRLEKPAGKIEKTAVAGSDTFWLRATLKEASQGAKTATSIRIAVAGSAACEKLEKSETIDSEMELAESVELEAVAVTTPVVIGTPFNPFGREPRIYDSFYVGCKEAFGKARATVWLTFRFGGAELGRMAAVDGGFTKQVFAVGTDGLLYRAVLGAKSFDPVPMPPELKGVGVASQAAVAARIDGRTVRIAMAGKGCVYTTSFTALEKLAEGTIDWKKLSIGTADPAGEAVTVHVAPGDRVLALWQLSKANGAASEKMLSLIEWQPAQQTHVPQVTEKVVDLIPVQGKGTDAALLIVEGDSGSVKLSAIHDVPGAPREIRDIDALELPETMRAAWTTPAELAKGTFTVGGYSDAKDGRGKLNVLKVSSAQVVKATGDLGDYPLLPIAFEPPYDEDIWPVAVIATPEPSRILPSARPQSRKLFDGTEIGVSSNPMRHFATFGGWTVVQHPDRGLYFRADDRAGHSLGEVSVEGDYRLVVNAGVLPDSVQLLADDTRPHHKAFDVVPLSGGAQVLRPFAKKGAIPRRDTAKQNWRAQVWPLELGPGVGELRVQNGTIELDNDDSSQTDRLVYVESTDTSRNVTRSIWTLERASGGDTWPKPAGFPSGNHRWQPLVRKVDSADQPIEVTLDPEHTQSWFETASAKFAELTKDKAAHSFYDRSVTVAGGAGIVLADTTLFPLARHLIDRHRNRSDMARFSTTGSEWDVLGPNQPANPDLSWEYWNGSAWWTLDGQQPRDTTADLQVNGTIVFTVPDDLSETDVGGRKNRWIRARLIGGDYGQARVKIDVTGDKDHYTQSVTRDLSAIRAPYVTSLKINYCAMDARPPERVVTEDNLGAVDQTSANDADLSVRFFSPVSTVLDPREPEAAKNPVGDGTCCDVWTDPAPASQTAPAVSPPLRRALMIGFDRPPKGDAVSLYVDAEPTGKAAELKAFAFSGGRFAPVEVVSDKSLGMSEPGAILLRISDPLDLAQLFGASAYWIALGPSADAEQWSPRLRGLFLNGVMAASVETRTNESIGSSTGAPDQRFRLVATPVGAETLDLWIAEPVGDEEAEALGALKVIEGVPGPWVKWSQTSELPTSETQNPERLYTLDSQAGEVSFGNGRNALIPPMASAILARSYQHVTGDAANGVVAGAVLQTLSPNSGVDKAVALDVARGGVDAETPDQALDRAPAKLRSGYRLVTLADLEEFVTARIPWVAQAHAAMRRGKIRLVVAGRGEKLTPLPSARRGVREVVAQRATFGITTRLDVVPPRPLSVGVAITLEHDAGADVSSLMANARAAIVRFFDHETGGPDGRGWPLGAAPIADDIALALADVAEKAVLRDIVLTRKDTGAGLPAAFPGDVLARVSAADVVVKPVPEAAS